MMRDPRYDAESEGLADMRPASWWFILSTLWGKGYYALCRASVPLSTDPSACPSESFLPSFLNKGSAKS